LVGPLNNPDIFPLRVSSSPRSRAKSVVFVRNFVVRDRSRLLVPADKPSLPGHQRPSLRYGIVVDPLAAPIINCAEPAAPAAPWNHRHRKKAPSKRTGRPVPERPR